MNRGALLYEYYLLTRCELFGKIKADRVWMKQEDRTWIERNAIPEYRKRKHQIFNQITK